MSSPEHPAPDLQPLPAVIELSGHIAPDLTEYLRDKIAAVLGHSGRAPLHAHVRVVRHADPARDRPFSARVSVRLAGATVHAHVDAATAREAADLLVDRLDHRIERVTRTRRGDRASARAVHGDATHESAHAEGRRRMLPVAPTTE